VHVIPCHQEIHLGLADHLIQGFPEKEKRKEIKSLKTIPILYKSSFTFLFFFQQGPHCVANPDFKLIILPRLALNL
jgi:hypothetical protein